MSTVLITGAGFSYPCGLPLASEVIPWLFKRWQEDDPKRFFTEEKPEIEFWIDQARACGMVGQSIDFEQFLAFLHSAESLWGLIHSHECSGARSENWPDYLPWPSSPGYVAKRLESGFLAEIWNFHSSVFGDSGFMRPAVGFLGRLLKPGDSVLTFNFDSILECGLFWALGSGKTSVGIRHEHRVSVYHLHGSAEWKLYELTDGLDDDPESTIHLFTHQGKKWKLRRIGGEYDLNPYVDYTGLQDAAVQMRPYKSIPWFLRSQWEHAMESLQKADRIVIIGYSFPIHDSVARFAIRTTLGANLRAKVINIDPGSAKISYQRELISLLGRRVEFIPKSWCNADPTGLG
jgi:hypothetical protein